MGIVWLATHFSFDLHNITQTVWKWTSMACEINPIATSHCFVQSVCFHVYERAPSCKIVAELRLSGRIQSKGTRSMMVSLDFRGDREWALSWLFPSFIIILIWGTKKKSRNLIQKQAINHDWIAGAIKMLVHQPMSDADSNQIPFEEHCGLNFNAKCIRSRPEQKKKLNKYIFDLFRYRCCCCWWCNLLRHQS